MSFDLISLSLRIKASQLDLIGRAAAILGKTRDEFMLEVCCREAEHVVLDQTVFHLEEADYGEFMCLLEVQMKDNSWLSVVISLSSNKSNKNNK